jgi:protoheme IX farnesyltransferase
MWTPPHFWSLALYRCKEYERVGVPMLPVVVPLDRAVRQMVAYTVALVIGTFVLIPVAELGWIYGVSSVVLGIAFIAATVDLGRRPSPQRSMRVFAFSITYVTLLFAALTIDVLVRFGI